MAQCNKQKFKFYPFQAFSDDSLVPPVILHDSETALCLNRSVHSEESSMDAFQIIENFLVEGCQFFIKPNCSVFIGFFALLSVWTVAAIFALVNLFLTAIRSLS